MIRDFQDRFPGHESAWLHRRFVVWCFTALLRAMETDGHAVLTHTEQSLFDEEITLVRERQSDHGIARREAEHKFAKRFLDWMANVLSVR